jgi:hypothetical protein
VPGAIRIVISRICCSETTTFRGVFLVGSTCIYLEPAFAPDGKKSASHRLAHAYSLSRAFHPIISAHRNRQINFNREGGGYFGLFFLPCTAKEIALFVQPSNREVFTLRSSVSLSRRCKENPIYVFLFLGIARPQSQFSHSCVCERFIYSQDRSTFFLQQNRQTVHWNMCINRSQTHECGNWVCDSAIPFMGKFVSILFV